MLLFLILQVIPFCAFLNYWRNLEEEKKKQMRFTHHASFSCNYFVYYIELLINDNCCKYMEICI